MPPGGSIPSLSLSLSRFLFFPSLSLFLSLTVTLVLVLALALSLSISLYPSLPLSLSLAHFVPVTVGAGSRATHFLFLGHGANRTGIFKKKPFCGHIGVCLACVMFGFFRDFCVFNTFDCRNSNQKRWIFQDFCVLGA